MKTKEIDKSFGAKLKKTLIDASKTDEEMAFLGDNHKIEELLQENVAVENEK